MRVPRPLTPRSLPAIVALLFTAIFSVGGAMRGQSAPNVQVPIPLQDHPYTLHVYADLLQVPTLVLTRLHAPWEHLAEQDFWLQIDKGPVFHPSTLHREGEEPLTLTILLDGSGAQPEVLQAVQPAIDSLFPGGLLQHDLVSVFAFDCKLVRSLDEAAAGLQTVQEGIARALASPELHSNDAGARSCAGHKQLWNTMGAVIGAFHDAPEGRRVLLVVSDGVDKASSNTWTQIERFASARNVAIFGLRNGLEYIENMHPARPIHIRSGQQVITVREDIFGMLCAGTGGLVLNANERNLRQQLPRIANYVRSRYILEFPRPANGTAGLHQFDARLKSSEAVIRTTGVLAPVRQEALANDPSTVPTDTSKLPTQGIRSILPQPH